MSLELDERQHALLKALGLGWVGQLDAPQSVQLAPTPVPAPISTPKPQKSAGIAEFSAIKTEATSAKPLAPGLDAQALRNAAAQCEACGLCQGRSKPVFAAGAERAGVMVVGESPTDADDAAGQPFMGQAGQLLDNLLASVGLSRDAVDFEHAAHLTHAVKCRPAPTQTVGDAELAACKGYLARQIELVQPKVIVAMGRVAIKQLLGSDEPLGKLRNQLHHHVDTNGNRTPVVVTYPPGYLLRNPADKAKSWQDLCLMADAADIPFP
jgi:uracil-DNA glycosylase